MTATERNRAVITGLGAVTSSGIGAGALWDAVREGRSGISTVEGPAFDRLPVRIGGQISAEITAQVDAGLDPRMVRRLSPVVRWAMAAASEALAQTCFTGNTSARSVDVIVGTGSGPLEPIHEAVRAHDERGPRAVAAGLSVYGTPDAAATVIAQHHGFRGEVRAVSAACASSTIVLGHALRSIRHGYADAVLVIGMDDCLNPINLAAQTNLRALARGYEEAPATASRPFAADRNGFVMAQGAVAILVENAESARARGAEARAEIVGYGATNDATDATAPRADGSGAAAAVRTALADAGAVSIDLISAHATGTPLGDAAELRALEAALGDAARHTPLTAIKSTIGHLLGASGAAATLCAVETLRTGINPPINNLDAPEDPDWDYVTEQRHTNQCTTEMRTVLVPAFGFGGHNAALVLQC